MNDRLCSENWLMRGERFSPDRSRRPSRSEFSVVFSETCVNTGYDPLERSPTDGTPLTGPGPTRGQLALTLQPNSTQNIYQIF